MRKLVALVLFILSLVIVGCSDSPEVQQNRSNVSTAEASLTPQPLATYTATVRPTPVPTATPRPTPTPIPIFSNASISVGQTVTLYGKNNETLRISLLGKNPAGYAVKGWCNCYRGYEPAQWETRLATNEKRYIGPSVGDPFSVDITGMQEGEGLRIEFSSYWHQ